MSAAREGRVRGSADPHKLGAEVRNCIWHLCGTSVKVTAMTTCLTLTHKETTCQHSCTQRDKDMTCRELSLSRGWVKINVSCYLIKLDF